jgi:hypothetical protein
MRASVCGDFGRSDGRWCDGRSQSAGSVPAAGARSTLSRGSLALRNLMRQSYGRSAADPRMDVHRLVVDPEQERPDSFPRQEAS